jgi:transcriptional regulator with XRE-family HTH domain
MEHTSTIEDTVRTRLRSLRTSLGLSLDDMAARTHLSASTISRIETGKRTISLDVLLPLARALQVDLDALLEVQDDDDVIIRPTPTCSDDRTTWILSRPTGNQIAIKMRLEPTNVTATPRVHPGHDWFFVIEGRVLLTLGEREIIIEAGPEGQCRSRSVPTERFRQRQRPFPNSRKGPLNWFFTWWRGQDLNLRPSGYEPWKGHIEQCRLVSFRAIYQGFRDFVVSFGACG